MSNLELTVEALKRCVDPEAFAQAMKEVDADGTAKRTAVAPKSALDVEAAIKAILTELGMPAHIKGYRCAITALGLVLDDPNMIDTITKVLYPEVAKRCDTTASRVERAIRHAIEVTWERGDIVTLMHYFGNTISLDKGKPTNAEFLAKVAEIVEMRLRRAKNVR